MRMGSGRSDGVGRTRIVQDPGKSQPRAGRVLTVCRALGHETPKHSGKSLQPGAQSSLSGCSTLLYLGPLQTPSLSSAVCPGCSH